MNKLRFSTFDDSLSESTLSRHLKQKSIRNKDLDVSEVLSVSNQFGFISQKDQFNNREVASKDQTNYKLVLRDEYAYNPARINVGSIARLKDYNVGIISPMYVVFELKKSLSKNYFDYFIKSKSFSDQMKTRLVGSVRQTLDFKSISSIKINLPSIKEQEKIGRFLSSFDRLIQKQQDKLGFLKELKKGYLQKMFPKNDANVPEIRFKEFTDSWEQYKFSQILDLIKDGTHGTHQNVEEGIYLLSAKNIKNGEIVISANDRKISESEYLSIHKNFQIKSGDILLTIVGTIGDCAILKEPNGITFQRSVAYLRPGKKVTSNFLYSTIMTAIFQNDLRKGQSISAQAGVYLNELGKLEIKLPSIDEQKLIGSLFEKIDNLITLHQRKLDQLENLKKGYMQRLFA
jgi:type I restriction enzyme S subunit